MKTNTISKAKRATNFALGLPIALTSLISQAYSSDFNPDYSRNQEKYYEVVHVVQMMPIDPIIDALNQAKVEIKNKIEFENSATNNVLKEVAFGVFQLNDKNSMIEEQQIDQHEQTVQEFQNLRQEFSYLKQQNIRLEQEVVEVNQQNAEIKQQNIELNQKLDIQIQQNMQTNAFLKELLQKFK